MRRSSDKALSLCDRLIDLLIMTVEAKMFSLKAICSFDHDSLL